jgi:hypothetical protein
MKTLNDEHTTTYFTLGTYRLRHPLFLLFKPTLVLKRGKRGKKLQGTLKWLGFTRKLRLIKEKETELVFETTIDIILIDVVIHFYNTTALEGLIDTPIGHLRFTGKWTK